MLYEHLPEWIRTSDAYRWLYWHADLVAYWNHGVALLTEIAILVAARRVEACSFGRPLAKTPSGWAARTQWEPEPRWFASILFGLVLITHFFWAFTLTPYMDMGVNFFNMSAVWAVVPILLGVAVLIAGRRHSTR